MTFKAIDWSKACPSNQEWSPDKQKLTDLNLSIDDDSSHSLHLQALQTNRWRDLREEKRSSWALKAEPYCKNTWTATVSDWLEEGERRWSQEDIPRLQPLWRPTTDSVSFVHAYAPPTRTSVPTPSGHPPERHPETDNFLHAAFGYFLFRDWSIYIHTCKFTDIVNPT